MMRGELTVCQAGGIEANPKIDDRQPRVWLEVGEINSTEAPIDGWRGGHADEPSGRRGRVTKRNQPF